MSTMVLKKDLKLEVKPKEFPVMARPANSYLECNKNLHTPTQN